MKNYEKLLSDHLLIMKIKEVGRKLPQSDLEIICKRWQDTIMEFSVDYFEQIPHVMKNNVVITLFKRPYQENLTIKRIIRDLSKEENKFSEKECKPLLMLYTVISL